MTIKYVFAHCGCSCQFIYEIILFSLMHVWICAFINEFWHAKTPAALYCDLEVVPWYFCSPGLWVRSKPKVFAPKKLPTNLCKPILPIESNYAQTKQKKNSSLPVLQLLVLGVLQQHRCQWLNGVSLGGHFPSHHLIPNLVMTNSLPWFFDGPNRNRCLTELQNGWISFHGLLGTWIKPCHSQIESMVS